MTRRTLFALLAIAVTIAVTGVAVAASGSSSPRESHALVRPGTDLPDGFEPAALRAEKSLGRYFVTLDAPAVAQAEQERGSLSGAEQSKVAASARTSQEGAIGEAKSLGGRVIFRYDTLVNGFSANLSPNAASELADRPDVRTVEPVPIVKKLNETSVPFIGAPQVWNKLNDKGQGVTVAVVDTGIDYTHKNFGGPGTVQAFDDNDPNVIEPGTFPTSKVVGGYDFVGSNYDLIDDDLGGNNEDPTNDIPRPDPDPLDDDDGHGSHTAGTVAGLGVKDANGDVEIGPGVAPKAKLLAIKVWDEGNSTADVLVAGYERAMDPNDDGDIDDAADVLSFSGGVDYGTESSVEARAAQRVVNMGTVFVASAGNAGNQPVGGSAYIAGTPANAPGVISVAASIDQFNAQTISINSPAGLELPDNGLMVQQDWGADLPAGGLTDDLFDARELDPPAAPGNESPADALLCDPQAPGSLQDQTVLVFKGSTGAGDCSGSTKVFNAQEAGATAVIMISLFGGAPSALSSNGEPITIPAVMISGPDGYAILDALSPGNDYNAGAVNATLNDETTAIPGYADAMTDFTSEGPARGTSALKPDITAPGFDIQSTDNGTGDKGTKLSGTSMAAPHVSGVAALLVQEHPNWSPALIKGVLMNQATQNMKNNLLGSPVSATVMGSGRVQAFESAKAVSVATPGSLSFGLDINSGPITETQSFTVHNEDKKTHEYMVSGGQARYSDFADSPATVSVSTNGTSFGSSRSFTLKKDKSQKVTVRLNLDPSTIGDDEQEFGWYYFHPNVDGNVTIKQSSKGQDTLHVPWHVAPLAASDDSFAESSLDLTGGSGSLTFQKGAGAGADYADLYLLGDTDPDNGKSEEDVVAFGARSFAGPNVQNGIADGVPAGTDPFAGIGWQDFLADPDPPDDPVEFGVQTWNVHNTTETLEVDVLVDAGADGVYAGADEGIAADYLVAKLAAPGGEVCVFDLSQPDGLDQCSATYFADYSNYNSNLTGLVVDAGDIGLTNADPTLAYRVVACTGSFTGDLPGFLCDTAGGVGDDDVYTAKLDASDPALDIDPLVCEGFFGGGSCDPADVSVGSAAPGDDPGILALFPNNPPSHTPTVITTDTGDAP